MNLPYWAHLSVELIGATVIVAILKMWVLLNEKVWNEGALVPFKYRRVAE